MKFGPVDVSEAQGAILAHSVALAGRARLRKGRVLTPEDLVALQAAGHSIVTVAQLADGDVDENAAADVLARAFVPDPTAQGLELTAAFTGRVNLLATGPGVVVLDEAAIEAVNLVDPMITIATVPNYQQMAQGGMIATIKIISYAVSQEALDAACAHARACIRLARPVAKSVQLIVTEIDGGAGDKGWRSVADRIAAFGLTLAPPVCVAHQVPDLSAALSGQTGDIALILTGSATSDIEDVAPAAVRAAGGDVARFGMPVDPGNLLFIGELGAAVVIGLPGCARSPALNGADWVIARVVCGLPVTARDIAGMGVGGLLKEIPSRPQPRRGPATV
ncbi:MAG: molybdopterin-binding protein [Roseobacter sp.]